MTDIGLLVLYGFNYLDDGILWIMFEIEKTFVLWLLSNSRWIGSCSLMFNAFCSVFSYSFWVLFIGLRKDFNA